MEIHIKENIVTGSEFRDRIGHTILISRALYGSKVAWHIPWCTKAAKMVTMQIWTRMRCCGNCYEYLSTYVDDLMISLQIQIKRDRITSLSLWVWFLSRCWWKSMHWDIPQ